MDVINDQNCFVCSKTNPIGIRANFSIDYQHKKSYAKLTLSHNYQGWHGIAHCGIVATLLDEAIAYACGAMTATGLTVELNIRYKEKVPTEKEIEIFGEVIEVKRKLMYAKSYIKMDGKILAEGNGKIFAYSDTPFIPVNV